MSPLTLIVAIFGALITYFQWRTAHQRIVLDLFDKRLAAFKEIEKAAKDVVNARLPADMELPFWSFVNAQGNARFLFGPEISAALQEMLKDITAVMAASGISQDNPEWSQYNDRKHAALQRLAHFVLNFSPLFVPYLRLDQKMPSVWLPSDIFGPDAGREA